MAKDDFHVIAYRILSYLYTCLKEGRKPTGDDISYEKFKIPETYLNTVIGNLYKKGYIDGIIPYDAAGGVTLYILDRPEITMDGVAFLQENSMMQKAKNFLKELKDFIP